MRFLLILLGEVIFSFTGILLLFVVLYHTNGDLILPLSMFDAETTYPNMTFDSVPYLYVTSDDPDDLLKKIKFYLPGADETEITLSISSMRKAFTTIIDQKKPWFGEGTTLSVISKLKKAEASTLRGILYVTTEAPDKANPVFDAWKLPPTGTTFVFTSNTTAVFLNNAPSTRTILSDFSLDPEAELSIISGIPNGIVRNPIATYKNHNKTIDPVILIQRAFTITTTGKAQFLLKGNVAKEDDEVRTAPATGFFVSSEYPSKSGGTYEEKVTYNRKMKFTVNGTVNLNDGEMLTLYFMNVKNAPKGVVRQLSYLKSGPIAANEIAERLVVQPSCKQAGAFFINYSTEELGIPVDPTEGPTSKSTSKIPPTGGPSTDVPPPATTTPNGVTTALLPLGLLLFTIAILR